MLPIALRYIYMVSPSYKNLKVETPTTVISEGSEIQAVIATTALDNALHFLYLKKN